MKCFLMSNANIVVYRSPTSHLLTNNNSNRISLDKHGWSSNLSRSNRCSVLRSTRIDGTKKKGYVRGKKITIESTMKLDTRLWREGKTGNEPVISEESQLHYLRHASSLTVARKWRWTAELKTCNGHRVQKKRKLTRK